MIQNDENKPLNVWALPPHKTGLFSKNFVFIMYTDSRKKLLEIIGKFHTKTPVLESPLNKVATLKDCNFIEKTPTQVFSRETFKNFKNTYLEEHLQTTVPECLRKISPLLVLGKPFLDGKRHKWATNTFYWKHELKKFTKLAFVISFKPQKRSKTIMTTILKYLEPPNVVEQF